MSKIGYGRTELKLCFFVCFEAEHTISAFMGAYLNSTLLLHIKRVRGGGGVLSVLFHFKMELTQLYLLLIILTLGTYL